MNEYPSYNPHEQLASTQALDRLDQELSAVMDQRGLDVVMGKYIGDEMSMTDREAAQTLLVLKKDGVFPSSANPLKDERAMTLEDEYRVGIFTGIMPLYQKLHTIDEYEEWLPRAIDVILPTHGDHGTHVNCHTVRDDYACWTQEACPLKAIVAETNELFIHPDFDSFDYVVGREKTGAELMLLLSTLTKRGLFSKRQERDLVEKYMENYNRTFLASH
jgi:hypothetical protein